MEKFWQSIKAMFRKADGVSPLQWRFTEGGNTIVVLNSHKHALVTLTYLLGGDDKMMRPPCTHQVFAAVWHWLEKRGFLIYLDSMQWTPQPLPTSLMPWILVSGSFTDLGLSMDSAFSFLANYSIQWRRWPNFLFHGPWLWTRILSGVAQLYISQSCANLIPNSQYIMFL